MNERRVVVSDPGFVVKERDGVASIVMRAGAFSAEIVLGSLTQDRTYVFPDEDLVVNDVDLDGVVLEGDPRLTDARTPTAHTHPASEISDSTAIGRTVLTAADAAAVRTAIGAANSSHTHTASQISDSTTVGRNVLTSVDAPTARAFLGAAASAHTHAWSDIVSGTPTTLAGYGITDALTVGTAQTVTGTKTFSNNGLRVNNAAGTFYAQFTTAATANRAITIPNLGGTLALTNASQTFSATQTFSGSLVASGSFSAQNGTFVYLEGSDVYCYSSVSCDGTGYFGGTLNCGQSIIIDASSSSQASPALIGFSGTLASGKACRFDADGGYTGFQSGYNQTFQIHGYWGVRISGSRQNNTPNSLAFVAGNSADPSLVVVGTQAANAVVRVVGAASQSGSLEEWVTSAGSAVAKLDASGNLHIQVAGAGLRVKEGSNATMGEATLVNGAVTVNTTAVAANSRIFLTYSTYDLGMCGALSADTKVAGTSFQIHSTGGMMDNNKVSWMIVNPA